MKTCSQALKHLGAIAVLSAVAMASASMALAATNPSNAAAKAKTSHVQDGWIYTNTVTATGQPLVTATKAAVDAGVIPVTDPRVYGQVFDPARQLSANQWQAILSMDNFPENGNTNYQDPASWRYCEVDYENNTVPKISEYRGNTLGPVGVTTVGDFPDYFRNAYAPLVLNKPAATIADMLAWGVQVTGVASTDFTANSGRLDPYPKLKRTDPLKVAALQKICNALQSSFDTQQDQYVMSHYAHIHSDKVAPTLQALNALGFTDFSKSNLVGLAFQVQVNTGSIDSIKAFSAVKAAGDCGAMAPETCFATYLTDQYIRWLTTSSLGGDTSNCWRATMALEIFQQDATMSDVNVVNTVTAKYKPFQDTNHGKAACPVSGKVWSKKMAWQ